MMARPNIEELYCRALYRVEASVPFVLRVGQYSDTLSSFFGATNCRSAAFLTAYNPKGVKIADILNVKAQQLLEQEVCSRGYRMVPAVGLDSDPTSDWEGEKSIFVLGISRLESKALGVRFHQLAILWCPATAVPELIMFN